VPITELINISKGDDHVIDRGQNLWGEIVEVSEEEGGYEDEFKPPPLTEKQKQK